MEIADIIGEGFSKAEAETLLEKIKGIINQQDIVQTSTAVVVAVGNSWIQNLGLQIYSSALEELGVECREDLQEVELEDLLHVGLEAKEAERAVQLIRLVME